MVRPIIGSSDSSRYTFRISDKTASCPSCSNPLPPDSTACPNCATAAFTAERTASDLPHISGYDLLGRIGEGGMGTIYLAEEKSLSRRVAIKVVSGKLASDAHARARFLREARSLATVEHANVVRIYAFGEVDGQPYLAMQYVEGETLAERIRREGRLSVEESMRVMRQILIALEAAWEKGIVHRDIKPSNVLLDRRGQVHVADFGLAKSAQAGEDAALTQSGHVLGTPYYVAPEQAQGKATDFRADIYSCGILLYEMLAGERPFEGTTPFTVVAKHLTEPLPSIREKRSDVPNRVARVLEWMAQKKPEARPASYPELIDRFDAILGITPSKPIATETFSTMPVAGDRRGIIVPLLVTLTVIAALFAWQWIHARKATRPAAAAPPEKRLVVAVTPFYGPDDDSIKEGRVMAALVERSITARLGADNVRVIGIDETKQPVRSHEAARQLGERLSAAVVVWGEAFALKGETEIQPYFTLVHRARSGGSSASPSENVRSFDVKAADPVAELGERSTPVVRVEAASPNQIELRKTSAEGVGAVVSLLAGVHALYDENNARKALQFFAQAPPSAELLHHQAQAYAALNDQPNTIKNLEELLRMEPGRTQDRAQLADFHLASGDFNRAAGEYLRSAATGQPYSVQNAIAYNGSIYVREVFRNPDDEGQDLHDTGMLLAKAPATGVVSRRWRIPGTIQLFESAPDGFIVRYAADSKSHQIETLRFKGNDFEHMPPPGGNLLLRMQGMKAAWIIPWNFDADIMGLLNQQAAHPAFHLRSKPVASEPQTLPQLESALREAARLDPTQPWHLFWLALTLDAEGRKSEADAIVGELATRRFDGIAYTHYNWMAKYFERYERRVWADRMYQRAYRERLLLPQPIQCGTLIERLINVAFMRLHPEQKKDPNRAFVWMQRAIEISGPTEADHYAASAWAGHFRRAGDLARARQQADTAQRLALHPFNYMAMYTKVDYALYALCSAWIGLVASALLLLAKANSAAATRRRPVAAIWNSLRSAVPRAWQPYALGFGIAGVLLIVMANVAGADWVPPVTIVALVAVFFVVTNLARPSSMITHLTRRERIALLVMFVLFTVTAAIAENVLDRIGALSSMPIGLADSFGHPVIVSDLESRLKEFGTPALLYATATANDFAGNIERAKSLYGELPDDPRAKRALAALQAGRSEPTMPNVDELYRAYTAHAFSPIPYRAGISPQNQIVKTLIAIPFFAALAVLIACLFLRPQQSVVVQAPSTALGRALAKIGFLLVPGAFDLRRASPLRGAITIALFGFALFFSVSMWKAYPVMRSPGIFTATSLPNVTVAWPFPPDTSAADLMFAPPYARVFWSITGLALLLLVILHAQRLTAIVRLYANEPSRPADAAIPV